jgi:hypothetical protein
MASGWFTNGLLKLLDGTIDIDTSTLKVMLIDSTYTLDPDQDNVDITGTSDLAAKEISGASGYTGGYAGSGRKTATITLQQNDSSNRVDIAIADLTWTSLGTGATIGGAALIYETGGADTSAIPIAFWDTTDTPTNGGNVTLDFAALASGGNLQIAV